MCVSTQFINIIVIMRENDVIVNDTFSVARYQHIIFIFTIVNLSILYVLMI